MDNSETQQPPSKASNKRSWKILAVALPAVVILGMGWQWYGRHFPSWDEEVLLSDGRMITVHRAHKFNTEHRLIQTALTFDLPEMQGQQTWREFLYPAIVDVSGGKVYVVGLPLSGAQYSAYHRPKHLYVAYVYQANGWQRLPFLQVPEDIRRAENIPWCVDVSNGIDWKSKLAGWCDDRKLQPGASRLVNLDRAAEFVQFQNQLSNSTSLSE